MRRIVLCAAFSLIATPVFADSTGTDMLLGNGTRVGGQAVVTKDLLPGLSPLISATNPETGTRTGPGLNMTDPTAPFLFVTTATKPAGDNIDGSVLFVKNAAYNATGGPISYFGSGAVNGYTNHTGDTHNNQAGVVGATFTTDTGNSQPTGTASSVGVDGLDVCKVPGCIAGWGGLFNEVEYPVSTDPTNLHYGAEIGYFANGSDVHKTRNILLLVSHANGSSPTHVANGLLMVPGYGSLIDIGINLTNLTGAQSAVRLHADATIDWQNGANIFDASDSGHAGTRFFKASADNNQYFDNLDGTVSNDIGFLFRGGGYQPATFLKINRSGLTLPQGRVQTALYTPVSSSDTCSQGQAWDDANYHYVCTATNHVKRVALSDF